jgi:hypothetical protein
VLRCEGTIVQWIIQNQPAITAFTGVGTLVVWIIYLQVFLSSYRRQLLAKILISRGAGDGLDARCFVSNMSSGPVYVQSIIVTLHLAEEHWMCPVTDLLDLEQEETPSEPRLKTRQGPLLTGEFKDMGTFRSLVRHVVRHKRGSSADLDGELSRKMGAIEIELLGLYGAEDLPIGATRKFLVVHSDDDMHLLGETLTTAQIRSRRDRKKLLDALERDR